MLNFRLLSAKGHLEEKSYNTKSPKAYTYIIKYTSMVNAERLARCQMTIFCLSVQRVGVQGPPLDKIVLILLLTFLIKEKSKAQPARRKLIKSSIASVWKGGLQYPVKVILLGQSGLTNGKLLILSGISEELIILKTCSISKFPNLQIKKKEASVKKKA